MTPNRLHGEIADYVTAHKEGIYRLAYSYVRNQQDALDVVQDSIHKALKNSKTLEKSHSLRSWFYKIVVYTALDLLRKRQKMSTLDDESLELLLPGTEDGYKDLDLEEAMDQLPMDHKSIVILRFFEDMKLEEIAAVLDENVNTIKTRLYRALKLLRINME